ncbi:uncharacterized protein LOC123680451 isoform X1 [Harmonia axyridis]|uniref:uncharacterized protein LOC123680451 isoform X1 n=1 Tax=Harmonia axyridis TaxID=115357 RepID=UPI001E277FCA|nr:uncharacterized protein LOC123680451 isoform X1 [Harmonia axyridis]
MPPKEKKTKLERKLEKQKRNQEKKRVLLFDHLEREVKYGLLTRKKHERSWKQFVAKIGLERIREDLDYTWQIFEWTLDIKDCTISGLMDELNFSNEQYTMTLRNHNMVIRQLLKQMDQELQKQNEDYLKSLQEMKNYYQEKNKEFIERCEEMKITIKTLLYRMEVDSDNICRERMTRYFCVLESYNAAENQRESVEVIFSKKMSRIYNQSKQIYNENLSRNEFFAKIAHKEIMALEQSKTIIRINLKKIVYLIDVIKKLQAKLYFLFNTDGERLRQLQENHEEFTTYLFILKEKLFKDNTLDTERKKLLVYRVQNALDYLRSICRKGELLMKFMSVNRRYETVEEKVLCYPINQEYSLKVSSSKVHHEANMLGEKLFLFHQKMAKADASRVALMEEKKILELERMQIRKKIQDFCMCCDCESKYPTLKREKNERPLGFWERTELSTFLKWRYQVKKDEEIKVQVHEIRKRIFGADKGRRQDDMGGLELE